MSIGASGQRLNLRLFLEGIEVPVIAAQIQTNLNAPATAAIQVVPMDSVLELKARTLVHLFFWDGEAKDSPDAPALTPTKDEADAQLDGYRLLFGGEVIGLSFAKTAAQRQAVLQCADWSTYWDTTYQLFISYGPNGNFLSESSAVWSGGNSMFDDILDGHTSVMSSLLNKPPRSEGLKSVKGLMGGIISLLEAMGGVANQTHGVNDFFTIAEMRLHILQQITAEANDNTAQRLFSNKAFWAWLNKGITSLGELVTFRDMIKMLFKWVYYESVPITTPLFVRGTSDEPIVKFKKVTTTAYSEELPEEVKKLIRQLVTEAVSRSETGAGLDTEGHMVRRHIRTLFQIEDVLKSAENQSEISNIIGRPSVKLVFKHARSELQKALDVLQNIRLNSAKRKEGGFLPEELVRQDQKDWLSEAAHLQKALDSGIAHPAKIVRTLIKKKPERSLLHTQIFRPDCFFAAPPKCNVFFPEEYTQFTYQRQFLQETTRLRLSSGMSFIGNDALLNKYYYAPAISEIRELAKEQGNRGVRALLPWEIYSGILPKFEHIAEADYIANKREKEVRQNTTGPSKASSYSQRAANFNYFKYRFAARSLSISSRFKPGVVCGFPAVVIERPFIVDRDALARRLAEGGFSTAKGITPNDILGNIQSPPVDKKTGKAADGFAKQLGAPTQYLGMVAGVGHNVDQSGGSTSVTLTHGRSHRVNEDDFLKQYSAQVTKDAGIRLESTVLDAEELLRIGNTKKLQFLINATPQDIASQVQRRQKEQEEAVAFGADANTVEITGRPSGAPDLTNVESLIHVAFAEKRLPREGDSDIVLTGTESVVDADGNEIKVPLEGGVQFANLSDSRTRILEPLPYSSKLRKGTKPGPLGGTVEQIQLATAQVVRVSAADLTKVSGKERTRLLRGRKVIYLWKRAVVWEKVSGKSLERSVPIEESIRPPWFSPNYSNLHIGKDIYTPFFGCGAVVDEATFSTPDGPIITTANRERAKELQAQLLAAKGDFKKQAQLAETLRNERISDVPDIESALDALAFIYGEVRRTNQDVHQFVANYTHRPIATMEEIFGTADLNYARVDRDTGKEADTGTMLKHIAGAPGFHSTAILRPPLNVDLLGLVDDPAKELPRVHLKNKKFKVSPDLDPRPGRRAAVEAYAKELEGGRGSLGVGLQG